MVRPLQIARTVQQRASILVVALVVSACASEDLGAGRGSLSQEGPWDIPADTLAIGDYEIEGNGSGARITNTWSDEQGRYFFVWVGNGPGWQYFFPNDASQTPIRFVFEAGTYRGDRSTPGVVRPAGNPSATCVMQPSG